MRMRVCLIIGAWIAGCAAGEVSRVEIDERITLPVTFDGVAYERLDGRVYFETDPGNRFNERVVDLALAPTNERGRVSSWANFTVLQAVDPEERRGSALLEVSNRGSKASLSYLNRARGSRDPRVPEHFGDGFLMRRGVTVVWVGWQWDVPEVADQLRLRVPVARGAEGPITGLVRSDWVIDEPATVLPVAHRNHIAYPVADQSDERTVLTVRSGRSEQRRVVPRDRWRFRDATHIEMDGGFEVGMIYELVYVAQDPRVVGLGLTAIRDMASYMKHDEACPFGVDHTIALGISQTGRFLRHYLYQGFNTDEAGRRALDGVMVHTAGAGRGSFNHRFAQPSRDAHRYSAFFYPTDIFPFTTRMQMDPESGRADGLIAGTYFQDHLPRVFYTNTGYEYWGRAAALIHTSVDGTRDIEPLEHERIYHLSSAQHFVSRSVGAADRRIGETGAYIGNPADFLLTMRALFVRMLAWVEEGTEPPASRYPRVSDGTLVPLADYAWPAIPGIGPPTVCHEAYRADYGKRWSEGIVDLQPPRLGDSYPVLVPQVDSWGNEVAGVRTMEAMVPLATFVPWSPRVGLPGPEHELRDFRGMLIPIASTEGEREANGDPRPSRESLFRLDLFYKKRLSIAGGQLRSTGFLLQEDLETAFDNAMRIWELVAP